MPSPHPTFMFASSLSLPVPRWAPLVDFSNTFLIHSKISPTKTGVYNSIWGHSLELEAQSFDLHPTSTPWIPTQGSKGLHLKAPNPGHSWMRESWKPLRFPTDLWRKQEYFQPFLEARCPWEAQCETVDLPWTPLASPRW